MKKLKKIPQLKNESHVREFWEKYDATEYIDWWKAKAIIFSGLEKTKQAGRKRRNRKRTIGAVLAD